MAEVARLNGISGGCHSQPQATASAAEGSFDLDLHLDLDLSEPKIRTDTIMPVGCNLSMPSYRDLVPCIPLYPQMTLTPHRIHHPTTHVIEIAVGAAFYMIMAGGQGATVHPMPSPAPPKT